jgi:hypothetical protein
MNYNNQKINTLFKVSSKIYSFNKNIENTFIDDIPLKPFIEEFNNPSSIFCVNQSSVNFESDDPDNLEANIQDL